MWKSSSKLILVSKINIKTLNDDYVVDTKKSLTCLKINTFEMVT